VRGKDLVPLQRVALACEQLAGAARGDPKRCAVLMEGADYLFPSVNLSQ
jgi:hypothetical protein